MKTTITMLVALASFLASVSISLSEEVTCTKHIKPLFDAKCVGCHGAESATEYHAFKEEKDMWLSKGKGMRMDVYSHLVFYTAWLDV